MGYIGQKLWVMLSKGMGYIEQKLWDILGKHYSIYWAKLLYILENTIGYIG